VNRNEYDVEGPQIELAPEEGVHYYDLYHGVELTPAKNQAGRDVLSFLTEAHGYGALLASRSAPDSTIQTLMTKMKELTAKPLANYSHIRFTRGDGEDPGERLPIPGGRH
jgi:hypothetical protein